MRGMLIAAALMASGCTTTAENTPAPAGVSPLAGNWHQTLEECAAPIAELLFKADGTFHVTWTPFETYEDYWGTWGYNAASGQLDLTIANGNYIPPDVVRSGRATIAGDVLTFEGVSFGTPQNGAACAAAFHRR